MKIIRSKGQSFTKVSAFSVGEKVQLSRGLSPKAAQMLTPSSYHNQPAIDPTRMGEFVEQDYALILRQTISVLDKVIRKRSLRQFELSAYIDRVHLADALWDELCRRYKAAILALPKGASAFKRFEEDWKWKSHPYAKREVDSNKPETDDNAKLIREYAGEAVIRDSHFGRWHKALWQTDQSGKPDYRAVAARIMAHLLDQELQIDGTPRKNKGRDREATGVGLMKARGMRIASSANDPRDRKHEARGEWSTQDEQTYFENDIVAQIFARITTTDQPDGKVITAQTGDMLYAHFGRVLGKFDNSEDRKGVWALHNSIRQFYQKLTKSEHFLRALKTSQLSTNKRERETETEKLESTLPRNKAHLVSILAAKDRNADISELIRLGKLVAHASDLPPGMEDIQKVFDGRMEYLVTSAGQHEIKRNESFTRVWRNSVGLSLQTLKAWGTSPEQEKRNKTANDKNLDVLSANYAKELIRTFDFEHFSKHLPLIFGNKENRQDGITSRSSIFLPENRQFWKEIQWAFLRLAGEVRNRTNHYNTKQRLVAVLTGGILSPEADPKKVQFDNRKGASVHPDIFAMFDKLLAHDIALQSRTVADEVNKLEVTRYVQRERLPRLLDELASDRCSLEFTLPKFMSVMRRIKNVAAGEPELLGRTIKDFDKLSLDNLSLTQRGVNNFQVGVLRQLYASGFVTWLGRRQNDESLLRDGLRQIVSEKQKRAEKFNKDTGRFYAKARSLIDDLGLSGFASLNELLGELLAQSSAEQRIRQSYKADAIKQRGASGRIDELRQDLFAHFFGLYIRETDLSWLWSVRDLLAPDETPAPVSIEAIKAAEWNIKPWHSQFYAWLYLIPNDDVALLRHQFKKTSALETNGNDTADPKLLSDLGEIDRLMGLYTAVQSAGFSGREHLEKRNLGGLFYEDEKLFNLVYSEENETHHLSLPGTRRGLRQILRYGHYTALEGVFERHRVTNEEVAAFTSLNSQETKNLFEKKNHLREQIVALAGDRKADQSKLHGICEEYRHVAVDTALYNFSINAARLSEHARLHHLMMRILGRLADFTLMWERDRQYLFLGMMFADMQKRGERFTVAVREDRSTIYWKRADDWRPTEAVSRRWVELKLAPNDLKAGLLPLWHPDGGFMLDDTRLQIALLPEAESATFNRYFGWVEKENQKDVIAAQRRKADDKIARKSQAFKGKTQIRNDFAHFNVIRKPLKLSYLVNAVRSLLSYDRKMKNAVSQAVTEILNDEGFYIDWRFDEDRLTRPLIMPRVETHLTMVRATDKFDPSFELPRNSVRFTSMVKALFEFDSGGYRTVVDDVDGKKKAKGELRYPAPFINRHRETVPQEMLLEYGSLLQN
ncbi:type VI-A CRISPR-associated RNA-guided ribonuclease Cas13a [Rhizobium leguminosarum]